MLFRFKTSAVSSIGSLFSSNSTQRTQDTDEFEMFSDLARNPSNFLKKSQSQNRLSDSRCIAMNLARNGQSCRDVLSTVSVSRVTASPTFTVSDLDKTPPLTPDLAGDILLSPCTTESNEQSEYQDDDTVYYTHKEEDDAYCGAKSQEIKEGKKAERPIVRSSLADAGRRECWRHSATIHLFRTSPTAHRWYTHKLDLKIATNGMV